jgi:hypothetical protein
MPSTESAIPAIKHASIFGFDAALAHETIPSNATLTDDTRYPSVFNKGALYYRAVRNSG